MAVAKEIPILNLYYLLLYAWNRLDEGKRVDVDAEDATSLLNLFVRVLVPGTHYLLKRGLDRGYISTNEDIRGVKGKVDFSSTIKRQLQANAKLSCSFDELSYNVLHNRILKTTIRSLVKRKDVDKQYRSDLADIDRRLSAIDEIELTQNLFTRLQLHRNNAFYGFLIDICELIYNNYLVSEETGDSQFREFIKDENQMPGLFEDFVRNFYKIELEKTPGYSVHGTGEQIRWDVVDPDARDMTYLPIMVTDVSIKTPAGYLILDTKYYKEALKGQYDKKVISSNLYQIFSYVKNIGSKGVLYENCSGVLLYPTVDYDLELNYNVQGHTISIRTLDLSKSWDEIADSLMAIVLPIL